MQLRRASRLALAAVAVLFVSISSVRASTQQLTLAGGGCSGLTFTDLGQKFHYTAQLAVSTGNETCIRQVPLLAVSSRSTELVNVGSTPGPRTHLYVSATFQCTKVQTVTLYVVVLQSIEAVREGCMR